MKRRKYKFIICAVVILCLLLSPLQPPAKAIVGVDDALAGGAFLAFLSAMGLNFTFIGMNQSKDGLLGIIQDLYDQYRLQHSLAQMAIETAWSDLKNSVLNGSWLFPRSVAQDMGDFAEWIVEEYDLTDNDSSTINPGEYGYFFADGSRLMGVEQYYSGYVWHDTYYNPPDFIVDQVYDINGHSLVILKNGVSVLSLFVDDTLVQTSGVNYSNAYWARLAPNPTHRDQSVTYTIYNSDRFQVWFWTEGGTKLSNATMSVNAPLSTFLGSDIVGQVDINSDVINLPGEIPEDDDVYVTIPGLTDVFGGSVEAAADQAIEAALDDSLTASYEVADEFSDFAPLEPPSVFNIFGLTWSGFGSIWHYVTDWILSIQPFTSFIVNLYNTLPYVLVLPLYGSMVLFLLVAVIRLLRGVH